VTSALAALAVWVVGQLHTWVFYPPVRLLLWVERRLIPLTPGYRAAELGQPDNGMRFRGEPAEGAGKWVGADGREDDGTLGGRL